MKRLARTRRAPWLVVVLAVAVLTTAAAVAVAGLQPANLSYTPNSEESVHEYRRRPRLGQELLRRADGNVGGEWNLE